MDYETSRILSREQIRLIAKFFRKMFRIRSILFPVLKVLNLLEKKFSNNLYIDVDEDENFEKNVMAELVPEDENYQYFCIRIRQSVYDAALKGDNKCLGFICHEMCHFILIYVFKIGPRQYERKGIVFARTIDNLSPAYKSMEWQAKALCGEVMIPFEKCREFTFEEVIEKTKSSPSQASYFIHHVAKGGY